MGVKLNAQGISIVPLKTALAYADDELGIDVATASYSEICEALAEAYPAITKTYIFNNMPTNGWEIYYFATYRSTLPSTQTQLVSTLFSDNRDHFTTSNAYNLANYDRICFTQIATPSQSSGGNPTLVLASDKTTFGGTRYFTYDFLANAPSAGTYKVDISSLTQNAYVQFEYANFRITEVWFEKDN